MVRWRVLSSSGLLVRQSDSVSSPQLGRLEAGATVEELQLSGDRLRYQLLSGQGPGTGWVSLRLKGKDLLCPCDGWQLEPGLAIGPWPAHEDKVTSVLLDPFQQCLWTASWSQSSVKSWHLAAGRTAYRRVELKSHGLVADLAVTQDFLVTAISANPMPEGNVCHQADFKQRMAELDDQLKAGQQLVLWRVEEQAVRLHRELPGHQRGCHLLSLCPNGQRLASASKDALMVSRVEDFEVLWTVALDAKLQGLCWAQGGLWSFDGRHAKLWEDGQEKASVRLEVENVSALTPLKDLLLVAHETGFMFLNGDGQMLWQQYTKDVVCGAKALGDRCFVAAVGCNVLKYQLDAAASKATAAGMWTFPSKVISLDCHSAGDISLVAAGCADGRAAVFDAT